MIKKKPKKIPPIQNTKIRKLLKNKIVTIFIISILLFSFTLLVIKMVDNINTFTKVKLETNYGNITIKLYNDMPITSGNFRNLVKKGVYNGVIFHRVIPNFMIQGGDPTGTGMGDPNIPTIKDEFVSGHSNIRGTVAMANTGRPNSGSSQFFINLVNNSFLDYNKQPLTSKHPVFGEVIEGMNVVDEIANVKTDAKNRPIKNVTIIKAIIE